MMQNHLECDSTFLGQNLPQFNWKIYDGFQQAIRCGNETLVQNYIQKGAQIDGYHPNFQNSKPLHLAVISRHPNIVRILLANGANVNALSWVDETPLTLAAKTENTSNEKIIDLILAAHKNVFKNPCDPNGLSHFHIACTRDNATVINHFLGFDVNIEGEIEYGHFHGWRPINFAICHECPSVIEILLKCKVQLANRHFIHLLKYTILTGNKAIHESITLRKTKFGQDYDVPWKIPKLHIACLQDDVQKIEELCNGRSNIPLFLNSPTWKGCTPLHLAVASGSFRATTLLLNYGADIMVQNSKGQTSLHIAFESKLELIFDSMMEKVFNKSPNIYDHWGLSIFHILCTTNKINVIESFLMTNVDIDLQVSSQSKLWAGFAPIHFAVKFNQHAVVFLLLRSNANIFIKNRSKMTPIDIVIDRLSDPDTYELENECLHVLFTIFSSRSYEIMNFSDKRISSLHVISMVSDSDLNLFKNYLEIHEDEVNRSIDLPLSTRLHKCTPLHLAMRSHNVEKAKLLLEHGADPLIVNFAGETPLECAFLRGMNDVLEDPDDDYTTIFTFRTPAELLKPSHFHVACASGLVGVVKFALHHNISENMKMSFINCRNDAGHSPLHAILEQDNDEDLGKEIAQLLLEEGADVNARDCELQTPLHYAGEERSTEKISLFINHGADLNAISLYGETPFHRFCDWHLSMWEPSSQVYWFKIFLDKIVLLLENGVDINIVDEKNESCLTMILNNIALESESVMVDCVITMLKHVKRLMIIGYFVSEINRLAYYKCQFLDRYGGIFRENVFTNECVKELEIMMSISLDQYTTLHNILFKSLNSMTFHCENVLLQEIVESGDFVKKFPIYGYLIKLQIKKGKIRRPLLKESQKILGHMIRFPLSNVSLERILTYLSDLDLKNIILCGPMAGIIEKR
ncbi:hypothetical protein QAD02_001053 [Eretmocerus hayati]|uniref:Uncharacterized protein n=1 Tax=Eretmocerus hayati TaxID=131215 RepID=A0ACC2NFC9_9HYME|nr:hypothetical protein QAD02_001053 [Eretmocerus hayati]